MQDNPYLASPVEHLPGDFEHGAKGYRRGCKCAICKSGIATYQRERRASRTASGVHPEGSAFTNATYIDGCRCELCRTAHAEAWLAYKNRKTAGR